MPRIIQQRPIDSHGSPLVVPFAGERVHVEIASIGSLIAKRTHENEFRTLRRVHAWFGGRRPLCAGRAAGELSIAVPEPHSWSPRNRLLRMAFCQGENLESGLENEGADRSLFVSLLRDLLSWMRASGFYWRDFAPRNILYDTSADALTLVDFESPLRIGHQSMSADRYAYYCQDSVILELAAVLLKSEYQLLCPQIWRYVRKGAVPIAHLKGRRRRRYVQSYFPNRRTVDYTEIAWIQKRIASFLTPFCHRGRFFYPRNALSPITDPRRYVATVRELERHPRSTWPSIIQRAQP